MKKIKFEKGTGLGTAPSKTGSTQKMATTIKVVVRVRPLNQKELDQNGRIVVDVVDDRMLIFDPKVESRPFFYQGVQQPNKDFLKRANKELKFGFDHICNHSATNQDVFEKTTKDILSSLMEGYNCSVFVYGATGAGKTFTMIGNNAHPGITYLTMEHLFYTINSHQKDREFEIGVSYLEVYNENVFDLLKPSKSPLQLREDSKYGVMVAGLTVHNINTAQELIDMLEDGNKNRTQHPTDANAESSRSHAVFQVYVKMRSKTSAQVHIAKLSMIDLAGSERASATGCVGERFKEGANINRSLLSLANCINKLADGSSYIPYRDSKLTRLLKDSLGGNCETVMIANVSPSQASYEDTYNTLKYAARASKIQLSMRKNVVSSSVRPSQYVQIAEELKARVRDLEAQLAAASAQCTRAPDTDKAKVEEWRKRLSESAASAATLQGALLALLARQRLLAARRRLRARAHAHLHQLAHRSSSDAMEQVCTEEIPRQERAADNYLKQSVDLDSKVLAVWNKWHEAHERTEALCARAAAECPSLADYVQLLRAHHELRETRALAALRHKQLVLLHEDSAAAASYTRDADRMLRKLYLTLKGYGKAPPPLTDQYLRVMRQAKAAKAITWSDEDGVKETADPHFKFISTLDMARPTPTPSMEWARDDEDALSVETDSEADVPEPPPAKRRGTPIKLPNDETIVIDDSFENLDSTRTMIAANKIKNEIGTQQENEENSIDPKDLNSTFVLAGKMEAMKKQAAPAAAPFKTDIKFVLKDATNFAPRPFIFDNNKAKVVKPVVGKALPCRRPASAASAASAAAPGPRAGFGSSLARDGRPLSARPQVQVSQKTGSSQKSVGLKAVRARDRDRNLAHPYSRPALTARR